jgi:hypothetical protein
MAAIDATDTAASRGNTHTSNLRWVLGLSRGSPTTDAQGSDPVTIVTAVRIEVSDTPDRYLVVIGSQPLHRLATPISPGRRWRILNGHD